MQNLKNRVHSNIVELQRSNYSAHQQTSHRRHVAWPFHNLLVDPQPDTTMTTTGIRPRSALRPLRSFQIEESPDQRFLLQPTTIRTPAANCDPHRRRPPSLSVQPLNLRHDPVRLTFDTLSFSSDPPHVFRLRFRHQSNQAGDPVTPSMHHAVRPDTSAKAAIVSTKIH